jgi:renalase
LIPQAPRPEISTGWLPERWVVHATAEWSRAHVDLDPTDAAARLMAALDPALAGRNAYGPDVVMAHRWRFAQAPSPLGRTHLWDQQSALGLAGDWCLGSTAEDAFASGAALARDVSRSLLASKTRATTHA